MEQKDPAYQHKISDSTLFKIHTFSFLTGSIVFTQRRPGFWKGSEKILKGSEVHCFNLSFTKSLFLKETVAFRLLNKKLKQLSANLSES